MDLVPNSPRIAGGTTVWAKLFLGLFLLAYFLYFSWDAINYPFVPDDMLNIGQAWEMKPATLLVSPFLFWRGYFRPLASLYQIPMLHFFGFNSVPFHVGILLMLLVNVYLMYRMALILGCPQSAAAMASLVVAFHPGMAHLYYDMAFMYDAFCFTFYLGSLIYYIRIRALGRPLRIHQVLLFLLLYLCALDAKEMALTLPMVVLGYEWLYQGWPRGNWWKWLRDTGYLVMVMGVMNLLNLYGKAFTLMTSTAFQPVFSFERLSAFQTHSFVSLLCPIWDRYPWYSILLIWIAVTYLAWRRPRPVLRFCWIWMVVTPLPIEFISHESGPYLYIPLAGGALFAAVILVDTARLTADLLSRMVIFRHVGRGVIVAVILLGCTFYWVRQTDHLNKAVIKPSREEYGHEINDVIRQFNVFNPQVRPHSTVVFLSDPFPGGWHMYFIARLWFRDRTVEVRLQQFHKLSPDQLMKADYLFGYENGNFVRLK